MRVYKINNFGDNNVLELTNIDIPKPKAKEILIKHQYITINHCDILTRKGFNQFVKPPFILGYEGFGVIEAIGKEVTGEGMQPGNIVGYATAQGGAYAEYNCISQDHVVNVSGNLALIAACFSKGLTAHYLMTRLIRLRTNQYILVHGAAGGLGHIIIQMAIAYGLNVVATVLNDEQATFVSSLGVKHIINTQKEDFVKKCMSITNDFGMDVVYDLLGGEYLPKSVKCTNYFGMVCAVGDIYGKPQKFDASLLEEKCIFLTKPRLEVYRGMRMELVLSSEEVLNMLNQGNLHPGATAYSFEQIPQVQQQMEQFGSIGSQVIEF